MRHSKKTIGIRQFDVPGLIRGDQKAFEVVYLDLFDMLFHLANSYVRDLEVSRELVQDSFLKLWEVRESLQQQSNISNFLYTLTKNRCLNFLKQQEVIARNTKEYLLPELLYAQEALKSFPDEFSDIEELMLRLEAAIEQLPPDVKKTFIMHRFDGLTYSQISKQLGISPKTVEARISKGLKLLRGDLKDYFPLIQLLWLVSS